MTNRYIGLDIAATTGYAFIASSGTTERASNWWERGTTRADKQQKHDILAHAKEHGVTHAVLERPVPMTGKNHATTQITMGRSYGRWEEACDMAGIIVVPCYVSQWQNGMLVVNGVRLHQNERKEASLLVAKRLGCATTNGDVADAVCLAAYGPVALSKVELEEEVKRVQKNAKARARRKAK